MALVASSAAGAVLVSGDTLKQRTARGLLWNTLGLLGRQGTTFVVSLFLCRLLDVEDFGTLGLSMAVIGVVAALADAGLVSALIREPQPTEEQWSTAFWLNVALGLALSGLLAASAGILGAFFDNDDVRSVVLALAPIAIMHSMVTVQQTRLRRVMNFKGIALASVVGGMISGPLAIFLAFRGAGIWALVVQVYAARAASAACLWAISDWRPTRQFRLASLRPLAGYIGRVFPIDLLGIAFARIDVILIGRMFGALQLGFYTRARSFDQLVNRYAGESLRLVLFSTLASIAEDKARVRGAYQRLLELGSYIAVGLSGAMYISATDSIPLLFSEKWSPAVPFVKVMLLAGCAGPIATIQINVLRGVGDGRTFMRGDVIKKVILILTFVIGFQFGILGFLVARVVTALLEVCLVNAYFVRSEVALGLSQQAWAILRYYAVAAMIVLAWSSQVAGRVPDHRVVRLVISIGFFSVFYLLINAASRSQGQRLLVAEIRGLLFSRRHAS